MLRADPESKKESAKACYDQISRTNLAFKQDQYQANQKVKRDISRINMQLEEKKSYEVGVNCLGASRLRVTCR